ncbi:MSEP-CTERM sorting domain-containing protein [Roseivirga sp. BDSF3-8]|uniref:MSEP-CTERM sorting domain-containing protein n=1 Tax=Roseivirga sp. BDSF3-8 TaxID=3241598 RepID=UPI00353257AF
MRNLFNPWWLFIINTLPICILFFLYGAQYSIIQSELNPESIFLWKVFGGILGCMALLNAAYTVYLIIRKKPVSLWYAAVALCGYTVFLYVMMIHYDDLIGGAIPDWMIAENLPLYPLTFLMPTLAFVMAELIYKLTPSRSSQAGWLSLAGAVSIPLLFFFYISVISSLWHPDPGRFGTHALFLLFIALTLGFLFLLFRAGYILVYKNSDRLNKYALVWKVPFAIVFPLLGLALNQGLLYNDFGSSNGLFGNFGDPWFFILAVVNGILLCLPPLRKKRLRLAVFTGRSITFSYTLYFFFVLLPYLPLSIIAIIAFGLGFLMLSPSLLIVVHVRELWQDIRDLSVFYSKKLLYGLLALSFLVLPGLITATYMHDRQELFAILEYMDYPDYSKTYEPDRKTLLKVVRNSQHTQVASRGRVSFGTPFLSTFYHWLVMDNLVLSNTKMEKIERVFALPEHVGLQRRQNEPQEAEVRINHSEVSSKYDEASGTWRSWVALEITNYSTSDQNGEYITTLNLPQGCYISDYYLYVGDRKEYGILAEKKSALWVYTQIRGYRRDPGILYYLTVNKVAFRVFPFLKGEVRRTGIEFVHKEPVELIIDDHTLMLGEAQVLDSEIIDGKHAVYIPSDRKAALPPANRTPYYHFIIDASVRASHDHIISAMDAFSKAGTERLEGAQISLVNSTVRTMDYTEKWREQVAGITLENGFFAERAMRQILARHYQDNAPAYPVMIVISDSLSEGIWPESFADMQFAVPESSAFYHLQPDGSLRTHSLISEPSLPVTNDRLLSREFDVVQWEHEGKVHYLRLDGRASVVLKNDLFTLPEADIHEKSWQSALALQAKQMAHILHPEVAGDEWLQMVKYSFLSKVMTPATSYIVVETEAQKAMLMKKQEEVLSGNPSLDAGEDVARMSEPEWYILAALLILFIYYRQRRAAKRSAV